MITTTKAFNKDGMMSWQVRLYSGFILHSRLELGRYGMDLAEKFVTQKSKKKKTA